MQAPTPSSKAAKFQALNPLDPIINPFPGLDSDERDNFQPKTMFTDNRLPQHAKDHTTSLPRVIGNQHADQNNVPCRNQSVEHSRAEQTGLEQIKFQKIQDYKLKGEHTGLGNSEEEDDSDDEWLNELESDPALETLREQRIEEMRREQLKKIEDRAKGHGEYRTISQDEFLPETTDSSEWTVVHFYHDEFEKCKIMDHHLKIISEKYLECKFLRINSQKAPFFCSKLKIRTLPTVLVFQNGITQARLVGFEGISDGNKWPTTLLARWLGETGAIKYSISANEISDEVKRLDMGTRARNSIWRGETHLYDD